MIPIKIIAIVLLMGAVTKFGHPLRAAVVFAVLMGGLTLAGGAPAGAAVVGGVVSLVVAGIVFWLVDRTESILLGLVVTIAGAGALILFG
jgi:hypothetical protein